jgi:hypothetical protein
MMRSEMHRARLGIAELAGKRIRDDANQMFESVVVH